MTDQTVLVVGAGVAGLAAAAELIRAGRRVVLIEARDRIGGRVYTLHLSGVPRPVELGAEFVHGHSNALWPLIARAHLATQPVAERHEGIRKGRAAPLPDVRRTLRKLIGQHPETRPDDTLGDIIDQRVEAEHDPDALAAMVGYVEGFHAADIHKIGRHALAENEWAEDEDGDDAHLLPSGYDSVPRWLQSQCASPLFDLRLDTPLRSLRWRPGVVTAVVRAPGGGVKEVAASQAVITLPLGVLKTAPEDGGVGIDPYPPGWGEALTTLEMGASHRLVLRYDRAWWNRGESPPISFVHRPGSAFPVWWASQPGDDPRLTGWIGGPRSLGLAGRRLEDIVAAGTTSLVETFGPGARTDAERVLGAYHHDWITDPYAKGVYSYGGVGATEARTVLAEPVEGTLFLSGEAVAPRGRNATVHGALVTGQKAAARILGRS